MERYSIANIVKSLKFHTPIGLQRAMSDYQISGLKQNSVLNQEPQRLIDTILKPDTKLVCIPEEIDFQNNEEQFTDVCYEIIGSLNDQYTQEAPSEDELEAPSEDEPEKEPEDMIIDTQNRISIITTEDEKTLLKKLEKAIKAHQFCISRSKKMNSRDKKRLSNRHASQVSRLKKKLEIFHMKEELKKAYAKIDNLQKLLNK